MLNRNGPMTRAPLQDLGLRRCHAGRTATLHSTARLKAVAGAGAVGQFPLGGPPLQTPGRALLLLDRLMFELLPPCFFSFVYCTEVFSSWDSMMAEIA